MSASRWRRASAVIGTAVVGVGIAWLLYGREPRVASPIVRPAASPTTSTTMLPARPVEVAPSGTPVEAVEAFLTAEIGGDLAAGFALLSTQDQEAFGSVAAWEAEHADLLPPIEAFEVLASRDSGPTATVGAGLILTPGLNEVTGLTPARADAIFGMTKESGGWRIELTKSSLHPRFLSEDSVVPAVETWVSVRQRCGVPVEYAGGLFGYPGLAEGLCGAGGSVQVGGPSRLDDPAEAASLLAAFGPEVEEWARVVPIEKPARLRVVVAPIGDEWVVIAALP